MDGAPFDLRFASWLPFRRAKGGIVWGPPSLLTDGIDGDDPVVALAAPRADFNAALTEFLIGLLSVALKAKDEDAWLAHWEAPPPPQVLREALAELPDAFALDGDGPRFLQDFTASDFQDDGEPNGIEALLIDAAGEQTRRQNKDLFVKRDRIRRLGRSAAAMALVTLQSYAPSGGQGHRVSLRGGGPLTTLIEPRVTDDGATLAHNRPLWRKLWANAETQAQWRQRSPDTADGGPETIFPWLAPTRTSNAKAGGRATTPQDAHPLQAWFGMPRRIRLLFSPEGGPCDLLGKPDERLVTGYRARNYGVQYLAWVHPASPHYADKKGGWLPLHGQPDGIGWRDWCNLLFGARSERRPARVVGDFVQQRGPLIGIRRPRLHAFGADFDIMKLRGWVEATLPAFALTDPRRTAAVARLADHLTRAANATLTALLYAIRDAKGDEATARSRFWAESESDFFDAVGALDNEMITDPDSTELAIRADFLRPLARTARNVFDGLCPLDTSDLRRAQTVVKARHGLERALLGFGKLGAEVFKALNLPLPVGARTDAATQQNAGGKKLVAKAAGGHRGAKP